MLLFIIIDFSYKFIQYLWVRILSLAFVFQSLFVALWVHDNCILLDGGKFMFKIVFGVNWWCYSFSIGSWHVLLSVSLLTLWMSCWLLSCVGSTHELRLLHHLWLLVVHYHISVLNKVILINHLWWLLLSCLLLLFLVHEYLLLLMLELHV